MPVDRALTAEALRIYRRFAIEVVEGLGLCPWAEHARKSGRVTERVLLVQEPDVGAAQSAIAEHAEDESVELLLLIFPRLALSRRGFEHYVAELARAEANRNEVGKVPFAMAAFHPDAGADLSDAERLIPFLRRSPDPTIQLVRRSVLEAVRERAPEGTEFVDVRLFDPKLFAAVKTPSLRARIAEENLRTVRRVGVAEIERILADIRADRDASYARALATRSAVSG